MRQFIVARARCTGVEGPSEDRVLGRVRPVRRLVAETRRSAVRERRGRRFGEGRWSEPVGVREAQPKAQRDPRR